MSRIDSSFDPPVGAVREAVARALAEDLGPLGDLTAALVPPGAGVAAGIVARAEGVLAGAACVDEAFAQLDAAVTVDWSVADGDGAHRQGTPSRPSSGRLASVLTAERTALNFLCHLSGVASLTRRFVEAAAAARRARCIWDTRKTLPGLRALEKAAVRAGGGVNHRGSLSDFVLVKDNHLAGLSITEAVARGAAPLAGSHRRGGVRPARAGRGGDRGRRRPGDARQHDSRRGASCVALVAGRALVEVSGGVDLDTVAAYAAAGADLISTSAITQSAPGPRPGARPGGRVS